MLSNPHSSPVQTVFTRSGGLHLYKGFVWVHNGIDLPNSFATGCNSPCGCQPTFLAVPVYFGNLFFAVRFSTLQTYLCGYSAIKIAPHKHNYKDSNPHKGQKNVFQRTVLCILLYTFFWWIRAELNRPTNALYFSAFVISLLSAILCIYSLYKASFLFWIISACFSALAISARWSFNICSAFVSVKISPFAE